MRRAKQRCLIFDLRALDKRPGKRHTQNKVHRHERRGWTTIFIYVSFKIQIHISLIIFAAASLLLPFVNLPCCSFSRQAGSVKEFSLPNSITLFCATKQNVTLIFVRAPPDGYLPAIDDSLESYEGSLEGGLGGEEGSGEDYQGSGGEEGIQFDLPEYTDDEDNLIEAENAEEQTTENPTEDVTEPIESNLVEEEEDPALKNAGETFQAPGPDIPEGDPANLPDVPPGPKVDL